MSPVVEGIEIGTLLVMLRELHCHERQVYFLSRPLSNDAIARLLAR